MTMGIRVVCLAAVVGWLMATAAPVAAQRASEGMKKEIFAATPPTFSPVSGRVFWRHSIRQETSRFLRVHFAEIVDTSTVDYRVVILDTADQVRFQYPKAEFGPRRDFWSGLVDGDTMTIEVRADAAPNGLSFKLREYVFQAPTATFLSISGSNGLTAVGKLANTSAEYRAARAIAKLTFVTADGPATCTGFLVGDSLLLTNEHCVKSQEECDTTIAIFGYEEDAGGKPRPGERVPCRKWIKSLFDLDVSALQLDGTPGARWGRLELLARDVSANEAVLVIQHPGGQPKQYSQADCRVSTPVAPGRAPDTDFGHLCDTMGGSSGSPVLDASLKVVGLHHYGFASDRWAAENRAVRMRLIVDGLRGILP
jgi:V8-like Glu-specific endopeptidase